MPSMLLRVFTGLLLALTAVAATSVYYVDDTDTSIAWAGEWVHLNDAFPANTWGNASKCYNKTFTVGQGYTRDQHGFQMPFTGTGITLFVAYNNREGLNVSVTLDSNFTTINWFIFDPDFQTPEIIEYNATLYDNQGLNDGLHYLDVMLQNYGGNKSIMIFDYAKVTGERRSIATPRQSNSNKIKAGIGGGVAALVALGLILLFSRRKSRRKTNAVELDLIDPDVKDPSLFHRASASLSTTFKPGHHRHHSSFSESATSPISPVKPVYARFMGQKHPFQQLPS